MSMRQRVEVAVVRLLLERASAAGFTPCAVHDGDEEVKTPTHDDVMRLVFNLDEARIYFNHPTSKKRFPWAFIVLGNSGDDCISDYSVMDAAFEAVMDGVYKTVEHDAVSFAECPGKSLAWDVSPTNKGPCINCGADHGRE